MRLTLIAASLAAISPPALGLDPSALPTGGSVTSGAATLQQSGSRLNVQQQSGRAILDWTTFNIGSQAAVNFQQPGASSVVLNRVAAGGGVSEIYGSLTANGQVFLVNPAGTLFARGAQVNVGSLVASSLDITNDNFMRGFYRFTSSGGAGPIVNQGTLNAATGGYIALLAPQVRNEGVIAAQLGSVAIGAGNAVTLDIGGTGLVSMQVEQSAVDALIENKGLVQADGGVVYMSARAAGQLAGGVINNSGEIHAARVTERDGVIRLEAGDVTSSGSLSVDGASGGKVMVASSGTTIVSGAINAQGAHGTGGEVRLLGDRVGLLGAAKIDASGESGGGIVLVGGNLQGKGPEPNASRTVMAPDARIYASAKGNGDGGTVVLWANELTKFYGNIEARGGPQGGDGGFVETSAKKVLQSYGNVNAGAPKGKNGTWLLDPNDITISGAGDFNSTFGAGVFDSTDDGAVVNNVTLGNAITNGTNIKVVTQSAGSNSENGDIFVQAAVVANLAGGDTATLSLVAQRNIDFNAAGSISSGAGTLHVNLQAGTDVGFTNTPGTMPSAITMAAGSSIITGGGNVIATANSNGITLAGINTGGGGTLTVTSFNGAIAQASGLSIGGAATFNAGTAAIALTDVSNAFIGPIALNNNGANNVSLTNSFATQLAASTVGTGTLSITSGGGITQIGTLTQAAGAGAVTLAGGTGAIVLNQPNDFTGVVNLSNVGANPVSITDANDLALGTLSIPSGSLTAVATGALNLGNGSVGGNLFANTNGGGAITQTGALSVGGATSLTAAGNNVTLANGANDFIGSVSVTAQNVSIADANALSLVGVTTTGDLTVSANGTLNFGTAAIGGNLSATSGNAAIAQTGAVTVTGTSTFNAGTGSINLTQANDFQGVVTALGASISLNDVNSLSASIAASGSAALAAGGNLVVTGSAANGLTTSTSGTGTTTFGATTVTGNLATTSAGSVVQTGVLTVSGSSSINAGTNAVTLAHASNNFGGVVSIVGGATQIVDVDALTLGTLSTGALTVSAGGALGLGQGTIAGNLSAAATNAAIVQSGALTVTGTSSLNAGTGAITLTQGNDFGGAVTASGSAISLNDTNSLSAVIAATGSAALSAGGNLVVSGSAGNGLTTSTSGAGATTFGAMAVTGNLAATSAGVISQTGALTVSGASSLNSGASAINLTNAANDFTGLVTASGANIALVDANSLNASLSASGAGSLVAAGALAVSGSTLATLATTTSGGGPTTYGALNVGTNLSSTSAGPVAQSGPLTVGGTTAINAGVNTIALANASNNFTGAVSLAGGTAQIADANALTLGTLATGALTVNAGGALGLGQGTIAGALVASSSSGGITQSGPLTVAGTASIAAGAAPILLGAANDFQGVVTLSNSGAGNAVLVTDANTITFSNQVLGGPFTVNAPTIIAHDTTTNGNQVWNGHVTFNSTETTNGGTFTVNGDTTLGNGLTVNAGSGNVTFQGAVNGTQTLSVNTTGTTTFNGTIGSGVTVNVSGASTAASTSSSTTSTSVPAQSALAVATVSSDTVSASGSSLTSLVSTGSSTSSTGVAAATAAAAISGPPPAPLTAATSSELGTVRITASSGVSRETIRQIDQQIAQARAAMFSPALDQLTKDPSAADVPECSGSGSGVCVKQGKSRKNATLADTDPVIDKRVAVLFGNDKYLAPIPGLQTPIHDVEEIGKVLKEKLGYEVRIVRNATRQDVVNELNNLVTEVDEDDSVFVYYAGHGYQAEKEKGGGGYWIPVDANNNDASTWISNSAISKFLANMASRQVMLISDSCYSGTLAQEQKVRTSESTVFDRKEILRKRSVLVMSSGGNEPVADGGHENHSLFAYHLIRNLGQVDGDLVGADIHQRVREAINKEYPQDPQYGAVLTAGHAEGGEYLIGKPK